MSRLLFLIKLNLKKNIRSPKYIILTLILPVILYILALLQIQTPGQIVNNETLGSYFMISTITFGILANSLLSFGTNLGKEKSEKWFKFLKVSSVSETLYGLSQIICFLLFCFITIIIIFILGSTIGDVTLTISHWIILFLFSSLGSIVFVLLGAILSCFTKLAQPLSAILVVVLTFLGGMWQGNLDGMSPSMKTIAKLTPTYNYANLSWRFLQNRPITINSLFILFIYIALFLFLYFTLNKKIGRI